MYIATTHAARNECSGAVVAVQIVKRIPAVVLAPALELPARERRLQLADRLAEREREDMPEPQFPALAQAFPGLLPLISSTTAKMALSGRDLSVSAFS